MPALRAVVFDLDDTLYPERAYVASGFEAVALWAAEHVDVPRAETLEELTRLFEEGVRGNTFDRWLADRGLSEARWVAPMVEAYRAHDPAIAPYPEVGALLARLRDAYRLGLLSDGRAAVQERKLAALGLASSFDAVVLSDTLGPDAGKPSVLGFERVLGELGVAGPEAVYVADNPAKDFLGAREAGLWTVRVRRPDGLYAAVEPPTPQGAADVELPSLEGLPSALRALAP